MCERPNWGVGKGAGYVYEHIHNHVRPVRDDGYCSNWPLVTFVSIKLS